MPNDSLNLIDAIKGAVVLILGLVGWNLKWNLGRQISRVDKLEETHIEKNDFNETLKTLRTDISTGIDSIKSESRSNHNETKRDLRAMQSRIDTLIKK